MLDLFWTTRVTVEGETPANLATSLIVTRIKNLLLFHFFITEMCPIENNDEIKHKKNVLNGNHSGHGLTEQ